MATEYHPQIIKTVKALPFFEDVIIISKPEKIIRIQKKNKKK